MTRSQIICRSYRVTLCCLLFAMSILASCSFSPNQASQSPTATIPMLTPTPTPQTTATPLSNSDLAASIVHSMTLDQKLGQMVIVEFYGSTLDNNLREMLVKRAIGGVLIENKNGNAQTRDQLVALNKAMQAQARTPLFISTDFEGGLVNELRQITGERLSEASIGATRNPQTAYNAGKQAAQDLTSLGLNVNFMPIVDVLTNTSNPGLPQRTFGNTPELVTEMGRAYLKGLTDGHIVGCLKHFPGLGSATVDPHSSLPTMERSPATLAAVDLVPYRTMIDEGIVPMVMVTHILNPQLDPKLPTSLSPNVVTGLLRNQLHFKGVIISDTLWMGGVSNTYDLSQAAILAVKAGTDLLLGPRGLQETNEMLVALHKAVGAGTLSQSQIDASVARILALKLQYGIISRSAALQLANPEATSER